MRWFSAFPGRGAGVGLLLLRVAVAMALLAHGASGFAEPIAGGGTGETLSSVVALAAGAALLTGLFTGAAAVTATLISSIQTFAFVAGSDASAQASVFAVVLLVSVAIALLGPGAFSIDSYRFGRREIVIPGDPPRH